MQSGTRYPTATYPAKEACERIVHEEAAPVVRSPYMLFGLGFHRTVRLANGGGGAGNTPPVDDSGG
eukprot:scaffold2804_cov371-Prasinococcus_capsulatus_cf.AAC.18